MSIYNRNVNQLSPEYALLGFLYQAPSHGYELHQRLVKELGSLWHIRQSQTYNILKRLETQGYIHSTTVEQEKLPPKQQLKLTEGGAKHFTDWLNRPTKASVHAIRVEFITRLYFIQRYRPERTQELIQEQAEVVIAGITQVQQQLAQLPDYQIFNRLAMQLRLELLGSVIRWLNGCNEVLGGWANAHHDV